MKLELNILENSLDFLNKCIHELEDSESHTPSIKYAILHLNSAVELFFKARLTLEHWAFVFEDLNKAKYQNYIEGDFKSINLDTALYRLQHICNINLDEKFNTVIIRLKNYRNKIEHFHLYENKFHLESIVYDTLCYLIPFLNTQFKDLYSKREFKSAVDWLHNQEKYFSRRYNIIKTILESNTSFKVDCPQCKQNNTLDIDNEICIFCNYSKNYVIDSFIKLYSDFEQSQEIFTFKEFDLIKICPFCLQHSLIISSTKNVCKCLKCKKTFPKEQFAQCIYCNKVDFISDGEFGEHGEVLEDGNYYCYSCLLQDI